MVLIDALERLGVSYLFQKEIEELLENMFPKFEEYSHIFHDNLFMVSLHFRWWSGGGGGGVVEVEWWRWQWWWSSGGGGGGGGGGAGGGDVVVEWWWWSGSSGVVVVEVVMVVEWWNAFERFTDSNGQFKETISSDVMGMLSLYEATFLKTHGEDILDKAFCFTKAGLESLKPHLSSNLAELPIPCTKYQPLQRGIPRVEARHYISVYEKDASRNEKLLRLAKIDFNRLQMLHKEELCQISRFTDSNGKFKETISSDVMAVCFEPQYSLARLVLTKAMIMATIVDDTYDAYGTYEELKCFTNAEMAKKEINYGVQYLEEATEDERSHVATGVECYMKQHGVSRSEAIHELFKIIENAWIDINEEMMMRPTMISRELVIRILNFACLYGVVYKYSDGYAQPECAKDSIIALYEDSIPI
ncbi:hypothetical protein C3L33_23283, partial [Rhododendron williamsianum]